jgi:DNA (cytosine-5)-methyltransferase 1
MAAPKAYYNEIDPYAAQWLRNLIEAGLIAPGDVDERDVRDVRPSELQGYTQCHFFAGIGGWSLALRLAGWPDARPAWTGSCPCQPFSTTGAKGGTADERHLWPHWHYLIEQLRPEVVFGEQVSSKDGLAWLDLVQADLETAGYACGALDCCAAGVGAPHIRQRLWFAAVDLGAEADQDGLADGALPGREQEPADADGSAVGNRAQGAATGPLPGRADHDPGEGHVFWGNPDWLLGRDGKWRPVEPGTFPLVDGIPQSVGEHGPAAGHPSSMLRAYGNAIVPQVAAAFVSSFMEISPGGG